MHIPFFSNFFGSNNAYDAARESKFYTDVRGEDFIVDVNDREALSTLAYKAYRNSAICRFAVNKHIQHISQFDFFTPDTLLRNEVYQKTLSVDAVNRSLTEVLDIIELSRVLDGDVLVVLDNGQFTVVPGTRIKNPIGKDDDAYWRNGVKVNADRSIAGWNIVDGKDRSKDTFIPYIKDSTFWIGYFYRPDQYRGITPLSSALTLFNQCNDAVKYALGKARLSQQVAFLTTRKGSVADAATTDNVRTVFGNNALHLDFGLGEDAKILSEHTPSTEFQTFIKAVIEQSLACLDIPLSFYDSAHDTYYGSKGSFDSYIGSVAKKQNPYFPLLKAFESRVEWRGISLPYWRLIEDGKDISRLYIMGLMSPQEAGKRYGIDTDDMRIDLQEYKKSLPEGAVDMLIGDKAVPEGIETGISPVMVNL